MQEILKTLVSGHVTISDTKTGEVLVDQKNAIHPGNMATAIARGLSNTTNFQIFKLKLGNRGTYIDGSQQIVFNNPITVGTDAELYNPTYAEIVDDSDSGIGVGNSVTYTSIPGSTNTRVIITCVISANEAVDNPSDTNNSGQIDGGNTTSPYFFDELGLFTRGSSETTVSTDAVGELMLSHLIFSPLEHTGNRDLTLVYTLTISVS
jgi:hypothetical protein